MNIKIKISVKVQALILAFIMLLTFVSSTNTFFAIDEKDQTNNSDIVRSLVVSYKLKGSPDIIELTPPYEIEDSSKIDKFYAKYDFEIKDNIDDLTGAPNRTVHSGDYFLIDFPENLKINDPIDGNILGNGDVPLASYGFIKNADDSWQAKIEFTDYIDSPHEVEIHGELEFEFELDLTGIGEGSNTTIKIPIDNENDLEIDITKPIPPETTPVSLEKTATNYNHQTRELAWNVKMMPAIGVFGGCVFTDTIDINRLNLKSIKHGNITLIEGTDYTFDNITGEIVYTIPLGRDGANFQNISVVTVAKSDIYESLTPVTISNQANLSGGDEFVDIDSNTATHVITPDWLGKSGTVFQGNKIKWTIEANTTEQNMYNAVITDSFQADVKLDKTSVKLGANSIPVYDNAHTPVNDTEVYGIYKENIDGTSELKVYLPRGVDNASHQKQTISLITDIVSPDTVTPNDPIYNNNATLEGNYVSDGTGVGGIPDVNIGQVGVAVPFVSVSKSHETISADDRRNGTITWTIKTSSNLSDYGKSQVVDTLPDDQDYIEDEIYWGSQKINVSTEPKAEISTDGRTLTITFSSNNALVTQQYFTVKTKIKQEIYGQNINLNFTNKVKTTLFDENTGEPLDSDTDTDTVRIRNNVIAKSSSEYNSNLTKEGQNPRVDFTITINGNLMPLSDVVVTDNLNNIVTQFKRDSESTFNEIPSVKWTYVPSTLKIVKTAGTLDTLDITAITNSATYINNILTVDFGSGVNINDKYTITFTVELDVSQDPIFKENGTIRCRGNIATIEATGLKTGEISTPPSGNSNTVKNELLIKSGAHLIAEQQILWTINLNQHRVTLDNQRVVDHFPLGLTLDPTSIKLYTGVIGTDGNFVTGNNIELQGVPVAFSYTYLPSTEIGMEGRYTLTVNLPDNNTDYILRFATDIDKSLLGKEITNSAFYVGETPGPNNSDSSSVTLSVTSGGGSTTKSFITVNKLSKDDDGLLNNAIFELNWLRGGDPNDPVFVRSLTATNGSLIFYGLTKGEKYTITEIAPPNGHLLDNPNPVEITVPLTGNLEPLNFYNTPIKSGTWTPAAIKKLDGKNIIRPFNFEIKDPHSTLMTGVTSTQLPNGDFNISFEMATGVSPQGVLNFNCSHIFDSLDPAGTEHIVATKVFFLKEVMSALPGYAFDNTIHTLIVKVYNVKGRPDLKVVIEDSAGNIMSDENGNFLPDKIISFQNTYRANGSIQLSAEKTLIGHALAENQFSFELYEGNTLLQTTTNKIGLLIQNKTYTGNVDFDVIDFTQADVGTKTYKIVEKNTNLAGYTYDSAYFSIEVIVTDNDDGTLSSAITSIKKTVNGVTTYQTKVEFINTYTTTDIDVEVTGTKNLSGRNLENEQFSFKLTEVTSTGAFISDIATVKNTNEDIVFPKLTFSQSDIDKTYYYRINELNDGNAGYVYDSSIYTIKIDVTDNHDGTLSTTQTITLESQVTSEIVFDNAYKALGKTQIMAIKTLTGKALPNEQFSFILQQTDITNNENIGNEIIVKNAANGSIVFPEINYTELDIDKTYYYTISELNENKGGYTYDQTVYTVAVNITDNGDGTLTSTQSILDPNGMTRIEFTNTYVTSNIDLSFAASKTLNGRLLESEQFTFVLNQTNSSGDIVNEIQRTKNTLNGSVIFEDISYTQSDMGNTYYYTISELNENRSGYEYDSTVFNIEVTVIDNGDGTLSTEKKIKKAGDVVSEVSFTNTYTTTDIRLQFSTNKSLDGRILENAQFTYRLNFLGEDKTQNLTLERAKNDETGIVEFTPLIYTQADMGKTYYYTISEINDNKPGYGYDSTVFTIEVMVIDNGDGTLSTETEIKKGDDTVSNILFNNTYSTTNTRLQLSANKILEGRLLENDQFNYTLNFLGEDKEQSTEIEEISNNENGSIEFTPIVYFQEDMGKTYYYSILEINDGKSGYEYDSAVFTIKVSVIDNGDGTLSTKTEIKKDDDIVSEVSFTNTYTTTDTTLQLSADKTLEGQTLKDGQFKYKLIFLGEDKEQSITLEELPNNANGHIEFTSLVFAQEDMGKTYYYTISEINDGKPGYEYDNTVFTIKVSVIDNGDGTLRTEYVITSPEDAQNDIEVENISFSNIYTARGSVSLRANKILKGLRLDAEMFLFELTNKTGDTVLQTKFNDKDGNIFFDEIFFNQNELGLHEFIIREKIGKEGPMAFDETIYLVSVDVTDNGDGTLNTDVSVIKQIGNESEAANDIEFINTYTKPVVEESPQSHDNIVGLLYRMMALILTISFILIKLNKRKYINN